MTRQERKERKERKREVNDYLAAADAARPGQLDTWDRRRHDLTGDVRLNIGVDITPRPM